MTVRRKAKARASAAIENRYDAAGNGRRVARWTPPASGPQRAVEGSAKLQARARDSARNDWAAESGIGKWTSTLVGVGIQPRWADKSVRPVWDVWGREADADGVLDIYGIEALMTRSWLESGECFIRRRPRSILAPFKVPLQVQLIESEFVPMLDTDAWPGMPVGHTMRQGIERNKYGRRTAYWVFKEHPGDKPMAPAGGDLVRVLANDMAHVFEPKRPGQLRGVSPLASILLRLRSSSDFEDAVLERQKLANLFTMFITRQMPPEWADVETDPDTGLPKFYDKSGVQMAGLEPGISQQLLPGEDVKFANPPEAGTTFSDYLRSSQLGTAAGQHMPYEFLSGDIRDVSDRTLRMIVQEFRRFAQQRQWLILIPMGCQRIVEWFADAAVFAGLFPASKLEALRAPEWSPHAWDYIHPVQDAQGKKLLQEMNALSTSQIILERGDDPDKVRKQRADDKKADEAAGFGPPKPAAPAKPDPVQQAQARLFDDQAALARVQARVLGEPQAVEPSKGPDATWTHVVGEFRAAQSEALVAVAAAGERGLEAQREAFEHGGKQLVELSRQNNETLQVTFERFATIEAAHAQRPLEIKNEINVPAPNVQVDNHVSPTPIEQIINVEPAAVTVDVNLPDRQIDTEFIKRDDDGNLTAVRTIEKTILN